MNCIKGKQTKTSWKGSRNSIKTWELLHTDVCGPFPPYIGREKYFFTFTDDHSRYGNVYLLHEKEEALTAFKVFKAEVENLF